MSSKKKHRPVTIVVCELLGSRYECGPGLIHESGVICGLSLLSVVVKLLRGFFFVGSLVFLLSQKPTGPNSNSNSIFVNLRHASLTILVLFRIIAIPL